MEVSCLTWILPLGPEHCAVYFTSWKYHASPGYYPWVRSIVQCISPHGSIMPHLDTTLGSGALCSVFHLMEVSCLTWISPLGPEHCAVYFTSWKYHASPGYRPWVRSIVQCISPHGSIMPHLDIALGSGALCSVFHLMEVSCLTW